MRTESSSQSRQQRSKPSSFLRTFAHVVIRTIGAFLFLVVLGLVVFSSYAMLYIVLPNLLPNGFWTPVSLLHHFIFVFFVINILFNYIYCIKTRNDTPVEKYNLVVKELATVTGFEYPETKEDMERWRRQHRKIIFNYYNRDTADESYPLVMTGHGSIENMDNDGMTNNTKIDIHDSGTGTSIGKMIQRRTTISSNNNESGSSHSPETNNIINAREQTDATPSSSSINQSTTTPTKNNRISASILSRRSSIFGPTSWGYCEKSKLPKPPRSHFDSVTRSLVLNMDHYCPWMINCVGYFNYRYFVNFLLYTSVGLVYCAIMTFRLGLQYHFDLSFTTSIIGKSDINRWNVDTNDTSTENTSTSIINYKQEYQLEQALFAFMIFTTLGTAVSVLLGFHLYLIVTCQSTIEFRDNMMEKHRWKEVGRVWKNPYDLGWKRNIEQVWGSIKIRETGKGHNDDDQREKSYISFYTWIKFYFAFLLLLLPSTREPEFLPVPLLGDLGKRRKFSEGIVEVHLSKTENIV